MLRSEEVGITGGSGGEIAGFSTETAKLVTEDAGPVDPGATEVELGYNYGRSDHSLDKDGDRVDRRRITAQLFTAAVTYGLAGGLDVGASITWIDALRDKLGEIDEGGGAVAARAKWLLHSSEDDRMSLAWVPGVTAPVGDTASRSIVPAQDYWSIDNLLTVTAVHGRFNVSADVGFSLPVGEERGSDRGNVIADVGAGFQWTAWLQPVLELNYGYGLVANDSDADLLSVTAGTILNLADALRLDLGLQQALFGRNGELGSVLLANFSWTF